MNAFIVNTSRGSVKIDQDEVNKVLQGISSGDPVVVRQGIINPSFFVNIIEDVERMKEHRERIDEIKQKNEQFEQYGVGQKQEYPQLQPLQNIFSDIKLLR